jgi:hypothetical protein
MALFGSSRILAMALLTTSISYTGVLIRYELDCHAAPCAAIAQ